MKISSWPIARSISGCLVMLLAAPFGQAATPQQQEAPTQQTQSAAPAQSQPQSSGAPNTTAQGAQAAPQSGASQPTSAQPNNQSNAQPGLEQRNADETNADQNHSGSQQTNSPSAVGTAAAPYEKTTGVTASRPAGAVIAPAKQRRVRSILIRVGIVVGAAVAVGTVVALSRSSSGRPN